MSDFKQRRTQDATTSWSILIGGSRWSMNDALESALAALKKAKDRFADGIAELTEAQFVEPPNGWAPRDVLAHLIGWNFLTIEGVRAVLCGELPSYFADEANGYSAVNAESVARYDDTDRTRLLARLEEAHRQLVAVLRALRPEEWVHAGVRYRDWTITVVNSVEALRQDYEVHLKRIVEGRS